jgi:hypothetical protein
MSLAMNAAPFHSNENQKKNKTIKNNSKVTGALNTLHSFNDEDNNLTNFSPLPPPSYQQKPKEIKQPKKNVNPYKHNIKDNDNENMDLNNLDDNFLEGEKATEYYKNIMPSYQQINNPTQTPTYNNYYKNNLDQLETDNYTLLLNKLNYMIHLLEENKDERTNNVLEEVVLYSFLGIFIIFLVDSFTRIGKYVR